MEAKRRTYRPRGAHRRAARRERARFKAAPPIKEAIRRHDPLIEKRRSAAAKTVAFALAAILAAAVHVGILVLFFGANQLMRVFTETPSEGDITPIEVAMIEPPPPPPPPPEEKKEEPPPEEKEEPKAKPEKVEPVRPPVPDPIDQPEEPEKPEEKEEPRQIVGLNLESTVNGTGGPRFATGNTRMGTTERVAEGPKEAKPLPKSNEPPPKTHAQNRAATHVPKAGVSFKKPERKAQVTPTYPERLRKRGIEADVVLRVTIDPSGRVKDVEVVTGAADEEFNAAAREAAMKEEYAPAMQEGRPIEYALTYTVRFRLSD